MSVGFQNQLRCFQRNNHNIFLAEKEYRMNTTQSPVQKNDNGNLQNSCLISIENCQCTTHSPDYPEIFLKPSNSESFTKVYFFDPYVREMNCKMCHIRVILRNL